MEDYITLGETLLPKYSPLLVDTFLESVLIFLFPGMLSRRYGNRIFENDCRDIGKNDSIVLNTTAYQLEFARPIPNISVPAGKEASLICTVKHTGNYKTKYQVAWVRAEDQTVLTLHTKVVTHNSRIYVTWDGLLTWQLHIRQLKESDRGCYMCQINTNVMITQQGCLDVYVPPDIIYDDTSGDLSIREGDNTTLWCHATGHPPPRITWRREDGDPIIVRTHANNITKVDSYTGSNLNFLKLDRKQMGAYLCIASNDVPPAVSKRILLNVNFAPAIQVPNMLLGAPVDTDVQLECFVEAFPNTINYWLKNWDEMLLNSSKYSISEERHGYSVAMQLIIRQFAPTDVGTYKCVSTNSLGRGESSLRLYEIKVHPSPTHSHMRLKKDRYKNGLHLNNDFSSTASHQCLISILYFPIITSLFR